jgi:hypothetical protein
MRWGLYVRRRIVRINGLCAAEVDGRHQSGWITANPAASIKPPKPDHAPTMPFEPAQIEAMLVVADAFNARGRFGAGNRQRIRAMILLLRLFGPAHF